MRLLPPIPICTVLATVALHLGASEAVGPFEWHRHLHDPDSPTPESIARDGTVESAALGSGGAAAGVILTEQWSGDTQAGGRSWSGNTFRAPAGTNYAVGLADWSIREGADYAGDWVYYPSFMQDAHCTFGFVAEPMGGGHGAGAGLAGALPGDAIVCELAFRHWKGGGTRWQTGHHGGNPLQVGVWQVPAGSTLAGAQADAGNRLGELTVFLETVPTDPVRFKLQVQPGGDWQLRVDYDADGRPDLDMVAGRGDNRASDFAGVDEEHGLVVTTAPAGGAHAGEVARTAIALAYAESPSAPIATPVDRRPLAVAEVADSRVSPVIVDGRRWSVDRAVAVVAGSDATPVPVHFLGGRDWFAEIPLDPEGPIAWSATQEGSPPTAVDGHVRWLPTDLHRGGEITIRSGDSLLLTYRGAYDDGDQIAIDAFGDGTLVHRGVPYDEFPTTYDEPGTYEAVAHIDADRDGEFADEEVVGTYTVHVVEVLLPRRIAAEVNHERPVIVNTGRHPAASVDFRPVDPALLEVELVESSGPWALLALRARSRGTPALEVALPADPSRIVAHREIHEFTLEAPSRRAMLVSGDTGVGRTSLVMRPHVPELELRFAHFAARASFREGATSFAVDTDGGSSTNGEPPMEVRFDPDTGEDIGVFTYELAVAPGEESYCYRVTAFETDRLGGAGDGSSPVAMGPALSALAADGVEESDDGLAVLTPVGGLGGINGAVCKVRRFATLIFTRSADGAGEDEIYPVFERDPQDPTGPPLRIDRPNGETWEERTWSLVSDEVLDEDEPEKSSRLEYLIAIDEEPDAGAVDLDDPLPARFLGEGGVRLRESACAPCDGACGEVSPEIVTGTVPGHYTTKAVLCEEGVEEPSEAEAGEFWVSKLDAHGIGDGEGEGVDTRKKFPDYAYVLPRRDGSVHEPVIRIVSGGQDRALYGVGTVTSELIDEVAYDWEHTVARSCAAPTNLWRLEVVARDPRTGENLPAGFEVRWRQAHHVYDGSSSPTRMKTRVVDWKGWSRDGFSGRNKEVVEIAYGPGRHFPRVEVWRTHGEVADPDTGEVRFERLEEPELTGYAEIHSLAVEAELDHPMPAPNPPVPAAIRRGTAFHLSNFAGGRAVDAKLGIVAIRGGSSRGRVSLDGYPQNEYRFVSDPETGFDEDLAQVLLVEDGDPRTVYLQGYESPSTQGKDDLALWAWGQAHIETCPESCWHLVSGGDPSPVAAPTWQLTDTEPFNACRLIYVDREDRRLADLELHNNSPGIELEVPDHDEVVQSGGVRRAPVVGEVRDALLPHERVTANRRDFSPVYPAPFVSEGLENGVDFPGKIDGEVTYSRYIDIPLRIEAVDAVGNLASHGYLIFLKDREKGFYGKVFPAGADDIIREVKRDEWFMPWHRDLREKYLHSRLGGRTMYPETQWETPRVGDEPAAPQRREDPFFRPVLQGFYDDYDPHARVRFAEDLAPKRVQFFAQEASDDVGACGFLMLAYDLLGVAPDGVRIAAPTDDDPDATAPAALDDLKVWEVIEGKRRTEKLVRTRHRAQLGWQPDGAVVLADQELAIVPDEWVTGVRVLTTDERGDEALLVRDQPLAGCELPAPAGEDRRKGFRVEAAHPDFRCEPQVAAGYDPRGWFDQAPEPALENQFDTRIHLLPGHGHRGRVFALRPDRKIVTSVYHPGADVVDRPLRGDIPTPWEPDYDVDPAVLPIKVVSGGFLRLHVAGDWDGAPRFDATKHLRNKAYMTMGDSLTAGFSTLNLRDREQLYGHGIQVARMMGVPFTVAQVTHDQGFAADALWHGLILSAVDIVEKFVDVTGRFGGAGTHPGWHHNVGATGATVLSVTTNANEDSIFNEALEPHQRITLPTEPLTREVATQPQGVIRKRPSLVMLGIGANNSLSALLAGVVDEDRIVDGKLLAGALTHPDRFRTEYEVMLDHLVAIRDAYGTDFVLVDVPNPSLAPPVVYRAREDAGSPTGRREDSFLDPAMPSYLLDFDQPGFEPYEVPMRPDGRSVDYHMGVMPLGSRDGLIGGKNFTQEVERARLLVRRSIPREFPLFGPISIGLPPLVRFIHPDRAGYGGGPRRNRYLGLAYWGTMFEEVLTPRLEPQVDQFNVPEQVWITDRERDRLVRRVAGFNRDIERLAVAKEIESLFPIQEMFDFIDDGGAVIDPTWWEGVDDNGDPEDLPPLTIDRSKLGAGFSGDLFHPLPTGYAIFGDRIIAFTNNRQKGDQGFGGFTRFIPRIIPEEAPTGRRPIDRVAEQDELLEHILLKRIRTITQYPEEAP